MTRYKKDMVFSLKKTSVIPSLVHNPPVQWYIFVSYPFPPAAPPGPTVTWRRFALHLDLRLSFGGFHFGVLP